MAQPGRTLVSCKLLVGVVALEGLFAVQVAAQAPPPPPVFNLTD